MTTPAQTISTQQEVDTLRARLVKSAVQMSLPELERCASLEGLVAEVWDDCSDNPMFDSREVVGTRPLDTSEIRRLARAELARRHR